MGEPALTAMATPDQLLIDDPGYQAAVAALPAPNGGVIYLEMREVLAVLEDANEAGAAAAARLAPFRALIAAGAPGTNRAGVARASLILVLADE